jgi:hypothetical protein
VYPRDVVTYLRPLSIRVGPRFSSLTLDSDARVRCLKGRDGPLHVGRKPAGRRAYLRTSRPAWTEVKWRQISQTKFCPPAAAIDAI